RIFWSRRMRVRNFRGETVDEIGQKVLKALRVSEDEVDAIVAKDDLFEPVRAGIRKGSTDPAQGHYSAWLSLSVRSWRITAVTALFVVGTFGIIFTVLTDNSRPDLARDVDLPSPTAVSSPNATIDYPEVASQPNTPIVVEKPRARYRSLSQNSVISKQRPARDVEEVGEFQIVTYTDLATGDEAGQIVRVELPRSSAFAMGIDLPVENQMTNKIKADLLIGEDGVMRAVRIVN